jgi:hypothetical protein
MFIGLNEWYGGIGRSGASEGSMNADRRLIPAPLPDHFFIEPPPRGFNPLRASDRELERYGLPHRPDPKVLPGAARLWLRVMRRIKTFVVPELAVQKILYAPGQGRSIAGDSGASLNLDKNWTGLVVTDAAPYLGVWGTWTIPAVQVPPVPPPDAPSNPDYHMVAWVGLGGYGGVPNLLQAGTAGVVDANGAATYYAWFEWFPQLQVALAGQQGQQNFPIGPGQTVAVYVGQDGGNGLVTIANLDTGIAITPIIVPIPTMDYQGNTITPPLTFPSFSAEWIVERPSPPKNGMLTPAELADFGELTFTNATALGSPPELGPGKHEVIAAASDSNAIRMTMLADDGMTPLADETTISALHVTFQATAAGQ